MSKVLLRFIVVVLLIAGITTAVYFILNKPDESKKVYDDYISLQKASGYKDYEYLTKSIDGGGGIVNAQNDSLTVFSEEVDIHYAYSNAIKQQIEKLSLLCAYAEDCDSKEQDTVRDAIDKFNKSVYGEAGVAYQAKYLYNYQATEGYDPSSLGGLKQALLDAFMTMEKNGAAALDKLVPFVQKYVLDNAKISEIGFFLYDLRGVVVSGEVAQYEALVNKGEINKARFVAYVKSVTSAIESGEKDGFNTLNDSTMRSVMQSYNSLSRGMIVELFGAVNMTEYINAQQEADKQNLIAVYNFMEGLS